jgi:hypothetical protein
MPEVEPSYDIAAEDDKEFLKNQLRDLNRTREAIQRSLKKENKIIRDINQNSTQAKTLQKELNNIDRDIKFTEEQYKSRGEEYKLNQNPAYLKKLHRQKKRQRFLLQQPNELELQKRIEKSQEAIKHLIKKQEQNVKNINHITDQIRICERRIAAKKKLYKIKSLLKDSVFPNDKIQHKIARTIRLSVEWKNITFWDHSIAVKVNNNWLQRFPVKNSKKSFNAIKSHYSFRNTPALIIEYSQYSIKRIINQEVLFYYIKFFESAGTLFNDYPVSSIPIFSKYTGYTKSYYKKHLPELFRPQCFNFLCELSKENLPIIPVPELIINKSGGQQVHDSFLFPILTGNKLYWLWESMEESKATYIFKTQTYNPSPELQVIFDYLTGNTVNKRETLIYSNVLKNKLNFVNRIIHTDLSYWRNTVKYI